MGLLQKLKSALGLGESAGPDREAGPTGVTVEHEPNVESEAAVKGTDGATGSDTEPQTDGATTDEEPGTAAESEEPSAAEAGSADEGAADDEAEAEVADETAEPAEGASDPVDEINGVGPAYADRLAEAGIDTVGDLAAADVAAVAEQTDVSEKRIQGWVDQAQEY